MLLRSSKKTSALSAAWLLLPLLVGCCHSQAGNRNGKFKATKLLHNPKNMDKMEIRTLASLTDVDHMNKVLDNICVVRVPGTPAHARVRQYISSSLQDLGWSIEIDTFEDQTPIFGKLKFHNIIAKWNPNANRYLTLACHYDSKYEKNFNFVGATDSAVPCMQLLNLATVMEEQLQSIKNNNVSLMLLFLDGEEAFKSWGPKDSIYGARHLAAKWHNNKYTYDGELITDLDKIDLFVLLDLIGAPDPIFYNYFSDTSKWYSLLSKAESALANERLFKKYSYGRPQYKYFQDYTFAAGIQDDHLPFLAKNVPIVHLIPYPFPNFWHTAGDNRSAISMTTIENLNKILRVFVASYLNMQV